MQGEPEMSLRFNPSFQVFTKSSPQWRGFIWRTISSEIPEWKRKQVSAKIQMSFSLNIYCKQVSSFPSSVSRIFIKVTKPHGGTLKCSTETRLKLCKRHSLTEFISSLKTVNNQTSCLAWFSRDVVRQLPHYWGIHWSSSAVKTVWNQSFQSFGSDVYFFFNSPNATICFSCVCSLFVFIMRLHFPSAGLGFILTKCLHYSCGNAVLKMWLVWKVCLFGAFMFCCTDRKTNQPDSFSSHS